MKNSFRIFALLALAVPLLLGQTTTTNTTLCNSLTAAATSVCLASTTGVVDQTGIYVDHEYMVVVLSQNQVIGSTNVYVPVARGSRFAGSGPAAHANSAVAWVALTPSKAVVPGDNGFISGPTLRDVGSCTRANMVYLPHIYPDLSVMRDCVNSVWVDYNVGLGQKLSPTPQTTLAASGALTVGTGNYVITKSSAAAALTLAAPTAGIQDGTIIVLTSSTAQAHTVTATGLLETGSASVNVATFAASAGAGVTLMAYQGKWIVLFSTGITFS